MHNDNSSFQVYNRHRFSYIFSLLSGSLAFVQHGTDPNCDMLKTQNITIKQIVGINVNP